MIMNNESVYGGLKKHLGREPREEIWDELVRDGYVNEAISDGDISGVLNRYQNQDERYPIHRSQKKQHNGVYEEPPDEWLKSLSEILAWDAAQEPKVKSFRHDVLNDCLLAPDEVTAWMKELNSKEGGTAGSTHIIARLSPGTRGVLPGLFYGKPVSFGEEGEVLSMYIDILPYSVPGSQIIGHVGVKTGAVSERLKKISESLHVRYTWPQSQAVGFVLTGKFPLLLLARTRYLHIDRSLYSAVSIDVASNPPNVTFEPNWSTLAEPNVAACYPSLITMSIEVSPHLSPKDVARLYSNSKANLLNSQNVRSKKRYRPMTKKHLELAVFYHKHREMKGNDLMIAWNKDHQQYEPYIHVTNLIRDAKYAHQRLTGLIAKEEAGERSHS